MQIWLHRKNDLLSLKILLGITANEEVHGSGFVRCVLCMTRTYLPINHHYQEPLDDATLSVLRTYDKFVLNALHYAVLCT